MNIDARMIAAARVPAVQIELSVAALAVLTSKWSAL